LREQLRAQHSVRSDGSSENKQIPAQSEFQFPDSKKVHSPVKILIGDNTLVLRAGFQQVNQSRKVVVSRTHGQKHTAATPRIQPPGNSSSSGTRSREHRNTLRQVSSNFPHFSLSHTRSRQSSIWATSLHFMLCQFYC
jgi:hypothetical protein